MPVDRAFQVDYNDNMKKARAGFTVVELAVVIAVIAILAAVTIASYGAVQRDARDTAIKTAAQQVADALKLYATRNNTTPDQTGADNYGYGFIMKGSSVTTIEDKLVEAGYLNPGFSEGLVSQNADGSTLILKFYGCSNGRYAVYASLNDNSKKSDYRTKALNAGCPVGSFDSDDNMNYAIIF